MTIPPKIYIGPMSLNIVNVAMKFNKRVAPVGLIASRRQVDWWGGYVNKWTTETFANYVREWDSSMLVCRDHGGPKQGCGPDSDDLDDGKLSLTHDCKYCDIIHIDPWKDCQSIEEGSEKTAELLRLCHQINPNVYYEIGTEEAIYPMGAFQLGDFVDGVKERVGDEIFSKVFYIVIQSGTRLSQGKNIGSYDPDRLRRMTATVRRFGKSSKEHNGDWIDNEELRDKFCGGLDAINIAPEFGQLETEAYLHFLQDDPQFKHDLFWLCYNSNRWKKWVPANYEPVDKEGKIQVPMEELIKICGHYQFSSPLCSLIMSKYPGIQKMAAEKVWARLVELNSYVKVDITKDRL
jgi:D-tagatose-1,6-bisphosphate aldolase subunit GatZ/KbaZ